MQENEPVKDDAALWFESRKIPVQDYEVPDVSEVPEFGKPDADTDIEPKYVSDKEVKSELNNIKLSAPVSKLIVELLDGLLPAIICNFTPQKRDDKDDFLLEDSEKESLTEALAQYLATKNVELSPAWVLVSAITAIYAPKFIYVYVIKKRQHEQILDKMQEEIELLKFQNEMLKNAKQKDGA